MRIIHVIPYLNRKRGGDVSVCYHLSRELSRTGNEVTIITTDFELDVGLKESIEQYGVDVIPFKCVSTYGLFLMAPKMKDWLNKNCPANDIIHLHNFRSYQNILAKKYSRKHRIPYVLQAHGSLPRFDRELRLKWLFDAFWGRDLLKGAAKVLALSGVEAEQYRTAGVDTNRIETLPNGIDVDELVSLSVSGAFKRKMNLQDYKIVLYLGRLHRTKSIDLLIEAFSLVRNQNDHVKLVICGPDGGIRSQLERQVRSIRMEEDVVFTGFLAEEEKAAAIIDSHVLVVPAYSGFPVVFLEACALGVPIVTTNAGDHLDWMGDNTGAVVEFSAPKLAEAIMNIIDDNEKRMRICDNCRSTVRRDFDWKRVAARLMDIYSSILEESDV